MRGSSYRELLTFMAVAGERSFRGAARRLGVSPSVVSRTIGQLEKRIGARLLNRTTRSVSLTSAGEQLSARLSPLMAAIDEAVDDVVTTSGAPRGSVRLNLPRVAAKLVLAPLLASFAETFPAVRLDLTIDDGISDIVGDGFDAGIRIGGRLVQDMAAVRLTPDLRNAIVGSPVYFQTHPVPAHPRDLLHHACLNYRWLASREVYRWRFEEEGRVIDVSADGGFVVNDTGVLCDAALAGMGLACLPDLLVAPLVATGRLVRVLEPYCPAQAGFFLYYPLNGHPPAALKAFIDFARAQAPSLQEAVRPVDALAADHARNPV